MNHIIVMDNNNNNNNNNCIPTHRGEQGKMCRFVICFALFTLSFMTLIHFVRTGHFPRLGFG